MHPRFLILGNSVPVTDFYSTQAAPFCLARQTGLEHNRLDASGGDMKKLCVVGQILLLAVSASAGFKVKLLKPKKAEQFQVNVASAGVTFAADLLLSANEQKEFFYRELTPSNIVAVRLAVFNSGSTAITLPLEQLQLLAPDGKPLTLVLPDTVAEAVLQRKVVSEKPKSAPVQASAPGNPRSPGDPGYDPRRDRSDPRYDPRADPNDPRYDPRLDPSDPRYNPNDPRNRGNYPSGYPGGNYPRGNYPGGGYPGGWGGPSIVLSPGGGGTPSDLSQYEKSLVVKDFDDKAHTTEPILPSLARDRCLYFLISGPPGAAKGYVLRLPAVKGMPGEILLKF